MPILATKILLVEDNPGDARLLREALAEIAEARFELIHRETLAQALDYLAKNIPDILLVDLGLPDAVGLDAVVLLRGAVPQLPLVVLTVTDDEDLATRAGAQDYLIQSAHRRPLAVARPQLLHGAATFAARAGQPFAYRRFDRVQ